MKEGHFENDWWFRLIGYLSDLASGPILSAALTNFVLKDPSEILIGFIYLLGFGLSAMRLWLSVRARKLEFLEKMVYRKQKKGDEELDGGIVDENSVRMTELVSKI